jgi:outer membrane protein assembly factor BamE (lipoprotein component of BamABCDE complex)
MSLPRLQTLLTASLLAVGLAGCMVPQWQKPGMPQAEVEKGMGKPTLVVDLPEGGQRLVYSQQPAGQQVYHMDFDTQRKLVRVEQVLDTAHFFALRNGVDTRDDVYRMFGPPAMVEGVYSFKGDIWTYRFLDNTFGRRAHVHIDPQGVVQKVMFTDESMYLREPHR